LIFTGFFTLNQLDKIDYSPNTTPEEWCEDQPCVKFGETTIVQPSSTVFVYLLGILTIGIGLFILRISNNQISKQWWGISLILWGIGALFAGTSYQAFSYEIKCKARDLCVWTSWWEIGYLILSVGSVNAMMVAQAYSCCTGKLRVALIRYSFVNMVIYLALILIGSIIPSKFLISFELMIIVLTPNIVIFLILNRWRYNKYRNIMDRSLLRIWISLIGILAFYFLYLILGITETLWEHSIWFSENDLLHISLMIWMVYIAKTITKHVTDLK
jgi:hypothetical protein